MKHLKLRIVGLVCLVGSVLICPNYALARRVRNDVAKFPDQIIIPNLAKIVTARKIGGWQQYLYEEHPAQSYIPRDDDILEKLGIEKGDYIFGFAGYVGDWLAELSRQRICERR